MFYLVCLFVCLFVCLSVCVSACLSVCLCVCLFVCFAISSTKHTELPNIPGTHCYVPQFKNRGNGNVINDHFRAKNSCDSRAPDRYVLRYVIIKTRAQIKIKSLFFFLTLWLFDFSALLLLLTFASSSCLIYTLISNHMRNYARCYDLMC